MEDSESVGSRDRQKSEVETGSLDADVPFPGRDARQSLSFVDQMKKVGDQMSTPDIALQQDVPKVDVDVVGHIHEIFAVNLEPFVQDFDGFVQNVKEISAWQHLVRILQTGVLDELRLPDLLYPLFVQPIDPEALQHPHGNLG